MSACRTAASVAIVPAVPSLSLSGFPLFTPRSLLIPHTPFIRRALPSTPPYPAPTPAVYFATLLCTNLCKPPSHPTALHPLLYSMDERRAALSAFKDGDVRFLIATDVAARGIDIRELPYVINMTLPDKSEDYIHRVRVSLCVFVRLRVYMCVFTCARVAM